MRARVSFSHSIPTLPQHTHRNNSVPFQKALATSSQPLLLCDKDRYLGTSRTTLDDGLPQQCCTRVENSPRESRSREQSFVLKGLASLEQSRLHLIRSTNTQLWQKARTGGGCSGQRLRPPAVMGRQLLKGRAHTGVSAASSPDTSGKPYVRR
jgi:hypothetical protein